MSITHRTLLRVGLIVAGLNLLAVPALAQSLSGNGSAGTPTSAPTGTAGTAASGPNASLPMFDAVTGKGLLTAGTPLPSGANALGTVGVTALPALPPGANAIGTVGITALPALPTGTNALGTVGVTTLPSLPAGTNSIGTVVTTAAGVTTTQVGGTTSATAGTFISALAASSTRKGCLVQNTSGSVMYVYLGLTASATITNSLQVSAGGSFGCTPPGGIVVQDNIAVASAGVSAAYVVAAQ
jgi:hypothetical protein